MKKLGLFIFFDSFAMMLLGTIIVMSASSTYSVFKFDSLFHLTNSHLVKVLLGLIIMVLFSAIPYELYKKYSKQAIIAIAFLLLATLIFAPNIKGAGRWINLGGNDRKAGISRTGLFQRVFGKANKEASSSQIRDAEILAEIRRLRSEENTSELQSLRH